MKSGLAAAMWVTLLLAGEHCMLLCCLLPGCMPAPLVCTVCKHVIQRSDTTLIRIRVGTNTVEQQCSSVQQYCRKPWDTTHGHSLRLLPPLCHATAASLPACYVPQSLPGCSRLPQNLPVLPAPLLSCQQVRRISYGIPHAAVDTNQAT